MTVFREGYFIDSKRTDPSVNLAIEEFLVKRNKELHSAILYLWQNEDSVIIGRNQNAYFECNLEYATRNGIKVIRRLTGGGAVYQDMGNLNYSMILPIEEHDVLRSTGVITDALHALGINAKISGRNDISIDDRKISGNAYYSNNAVGLHHGTLLYRADIGRIEDVLNVSSLKLKRHGITSVRARVGDIATLFPDITMQDIRNAIRESFRNTYKIGLLRKMDISEATIQEYAKRYASREWNIEKVKDEEGSDALGY